ncbi:hypothetical protein ACFX15_039267 [Malus domestica]
MVIMMTGNKSDLNHLRTSSEDDGQPLTKRESLSFLETSALEVTNINELKLKLQTVETDKREVTKAIRVDEPGPASWEQDR